MSSSYGAAVPGEQEEVPVCPRHPGTISYVRCQRCGRPTCPACQRPAAVGVQCVDCVTAEAAEHPRQRSAAGMTAAPGRPWVTLGIIGICVAVWLAEMASYSFFLRVAFITVAAKNEPWRFIASGFAHSTATPLHLLFNMYALYVVGQYLEPLLGRARFACLYLLSVIGGSVGYELLTSPPHPGGDFYAAGWTQPLVGASGGVFGLFVAVVVLNRYLGREIRPMLTVIAVNAVLGFAMTNVAWQAHVGGAVVGGIGAGALYALRRRPGALQFSVLAALTVALFALAYVRFSMVDLSGFAVQI